MSSDLIIVKNSGERFTARYDGQVYVFEKGDKVPISVDAARHLFGLGLEDKSEVFARHGWMERSTDYEKCMTRLNQFSFEVGVVKIVSDATPELETKEQESGHIPPLEDEGTDETEQGSAPLQPDAGGGVKASDGAEKEPPASTHKTRLAMTDGIFKPA